MNLRAMRLACTLAALPLAGCGWLPDAYSGCNELQTYQPDTRNALKIPDLKTPELPRDPATCLEHPPPYGAERPQAKADS
jgi:hypothetical protein